jgi:hypothetical protein
MIKRALREMEIKKTTAKNEIIVMINGVKERREKLKWPWKIMKRETMRR